MLCEQCNNREAVVHVTEANSPEATLHHFCKQCADHVSYHDIPIFANAQSIKGKDIFYFSGKVVKLDVDTLKILVRHSSHYQAGRELYLRARFVPHDRHRIGSEIELFGPQDCRSLIVVGEK